MKAFFLLKLLVVGIMKGVKVMLRSDGLDTVHTARSSVGVEKYLKCMLLNSIG